MSSFVSTPATCQADGSPFTTDSSRLTIPPLLTVDHAAELADCSPDTIRRMVARGEIEAVRFGKRLLRVRAESVLGAGRAIRESA